MSLRLAKQRACMTMSAKSRCCCDVSHCMGFGTCPCDSTLQGRTKRRGLTFGARIFPMTSWGYFHFDLLRGRVRKNGASRFMFLPWQSWKKNHVAGVGVPVTYPKRFTGRFCRNCVLQHSWKQLFKKWKIGVLICVSRRLHVSCEPCFGIAMTYSQKAGARFAEVIPQNLCRMRWEIPSVPTPGWSDAGPCAKNCGDHVANLCNGACNKNLRILCVGARVEVFPGCW